MKILFLISFGGLSVIIWSLICIGWMQERHYSKMPPHACIQGQALHPGETCYFGLFRPLLKEKQPRNPN